MTGRRWRVKKRPNGLWGVYRDRILMDSWATHRMAIRDAHRMAADDARAEWMKRETEALAGYPKALARLHYTRQEQS